MVIGSICGCDSDYLRLRNYDLTNGVRYLKIETFQRVEPTTGIVVEEFECYRDKVSNRPTGHGYYRTYEHDGTFIQAGQYQHGRKVGDWQYFSQGILESEETYFDGHLRSRLEHHFVHAENDGMVIEVGYQRRQFSFEGQTLVETTVYKTLAPPDDHGRFLWKALVIEYRGTDPTSVGRWEEIAHRGQGITTFEDLQRLPIRQVSDSDCDVDSLVCAEEIGVSEQESISAHILAEPAMHTVLLEDILTGRNPPKSNSDGVSTIGDLPGITIIDVGWLGL
jgi:hypothetical protein